MSIFVGLEHVVRQNEVLAPYTWLRVGGAAQYFAEPTSLEELREIVRRCAAEDIPIRVLGAGSNVLVRDEGVAGMVITLAAPSFCGIRVAERTITAGAGARLGHVVSTAVREGLAGLEQFVGIPGTIGGAISCDVISHGTSISQWMATVVVLQRDGAIKRIQRFELDESYRRSHLDRTVILEADFQLEPGDQRHLTQRLQQVWIVRRASQPLVGQCAARLFTHPGWTTATALIEQAGLKGTRVGHVELSERDANFVVAHPGATAREILQLMELVQNTVRDKLGVELERALQIW